MYVLNYALSLRVSLISNIHQKIPSQAIPVMFVLMDRKTEALYHEVYEHCKVLRPAFSPKTAVADYEAANYKAMETSFPGMEFSGCLFHFSQAVMRKMRKVMGTN